MDITFQKLAVFFLALGFFAFVTLSIFGLGHMSGMTASENGDMAGCIFTGKTMLCKMSVVEHISLWQSMLTVAPQENLMLLALFTLFIAVIFMTKNIPVPLDLSRGETQIRRFYLKEHSNLSFFNPLKEAFSQGILNPKIYGLATL